MDIEEFEKRMAIITSAIADAGQDVKEQLNAYAFTGEPAYITRRNNARELIKDISPESILRYLEQCSPNENQH